MSIIAAGTTTTTALSSTGNTDGTIQLQVNGTTPSVTLNALGAVGVGASPNFGTSGQVLISGGSTAAPTWGTPSAATTATNLAGGTAGVVPYQTGAGATAFTAAGTTGQVLQSNGTAAPTWTTIAASQWTTSGSNISYTTGQVQIGTGSAAAPALSVASDTNTGIFFPAADTVAFAEGGAESMRLDSSGNLGLGVVPSAWSTGTALQVRRASFYTFANDSLEISLNGAVIGGAWQRIATDFATKYGQDTGRHTWYTAANSSAGSAITWTQQFAINNSGAIGVGSGNSTGTSGQVLTSAGSGAAPTWTTPGGGGFSNMDVFTSSGTWSVPTGVTKCRVTVVGGGGGGAGSPAGGAGGGSGASAIKTLVVSGGSATVTIGSGGAGATSGNIGGTGGTSSFVYGVTTVSCTGGGGAYYNSRTGGDGGNASGGDFNIKGGGGGSSGSTSSAQTQGGATGAASMFGGGGRAGSPDSSGDNVGGNGGANTGGGGGGGGRSSNGGNGGSGVVLIEY
jgi:hypothetical protein